MILRKKTLPIKVGNRIIGGNNPILIQSMTNTDTVDIEKTVDQILALENEGCEIVRASIYDMECAKAIKEIKKRINIPFVSDIHFDYKIAIEAIENGTDKLRLNPGNIGSTDRVRQVVERAKDKGVPIRIGVNGGSLKKEILSKYNGVTPEALTESALEHVGILEKLNFYDIIVSIKSSNVQTNHQANILLSEKISYPLHIGVTEAGFGNQAIIKASAGIGALLLNGIGDTIRVSITGDPVNEIKSAKEILKALGVRNEGVEVISCPTCARCKVELEPIAMEVEKRLAKINKNIKVAVMGCVVNGPGEAKDADIGVAFAKDKSTLFKKGELVATVENDRVVNELERLALGL